MAALKRNGLEVSCVNLSCGYYEPHTDNEYTILSDLCKCYRFVPVSYTHLDVYKRQRYTGIPGLEFTERQRTGMRNARCSMKSRADWEGVGTL